VLVALAGSEPSTDPHYRVATDRAVGIYETGVAGSLELRGTVHHGGAQLDPAMRSARLLARLCRLHAVRFGDSVRLPRETASFDTWLVDQSAADPSIGGETRTRNIYVWDAASKRSPAEWTRTLCHEFGHLVLPAARGYAAPESDAAGYLGEALYMEFLLGDDAPAGPDDHSRFDDVHRYASDRNLPRETRFHSAGPASRVLDRLDGTGMDYYIGGALASLRAFGAPILWKALRGIDDESPRELFASLRHVLLGQREIAVKLPAWVPLFADRYRIAPKDGPGVVRLGDSPPLALDGPKTVRFDAPGWRRFTSGTGRSTEIILRRGAG